jgi:small subunit ribosomal protein S13e
MYAPGKGIARSARPYRRAPPSWCKIEADAVKEEILKNAKKGMTPSQIGVQLRDSHGIPQVTSRSLSPCGRVYLLDF